MLEHPLYDKALYDLKPTSAGKLAVARGRGGPVNLAWEIHGRGPVRILVRALFSAGARGVPAAAPGRPLDLSAPG